MSFLCRIVAGPFSIPHQEVVELGETDRIYIWSIGKQMNTFSFDTSSDRSSEDVSATSPSESYVWEKIVLPHFDTSFPHVISLSVYISILNALAPLFARTQPKETNSWRGQSRDWAWKMYWYRDTFEMNHNLHGRTSASVSRKERGPHRSRRFLPWTER